MIEAEKPTVAAPPGHRLLPPALAAGAVVLFLAVGLLGLYRYLHAYWLYRGFPPPKEPAFVNDVGTFQTIRVKSAAIGGRSQRVVVYLPPGYAKNTAQRYPVLYLLHGFPGNPDGFVLTVRVGVVEDTLLAKHEMKPMIIVMPFGSTGVFTDKEWANGIGPDQGWETFFARDVVNSIDARYRTIKSGSARAVGGLSEGGYAALNIGLQHPREFRVLESWSGYEKADNVKSIFGGQQALLDANSPALTLPKAAAQLRKENTYVWFYTGSKDSLKKQNANFSAELTRYRIPHRFFLVDGGHNWALWRNNAWQAVQVASARMTHG